MSSVSIAMPSVPGFFARSMAYLKVYGPHKIARPFVEPVHPRPQLVRKLPTSGEEKVSRRR